LPRQSIARESLASQGHAILVETRADLANVANTIAAEHLALHVEEPNALLEQIESAGAAFLGSVTPEACGDYFAGPSHVLPTGGAVRFGSPLGVYDFYKRTSVVAYDFATLAAHAPAIARFARLEQLEAHARAVEIRLKP
jgi:histidinol dehydrogenase